MPTQHTPDLGYQALIRDLHPDLDPALVEAWMRTSFYALDGLSRAQFREAADAAADCVRLQPKLSLALAHSFGLKVGGDHA